MIELVWNALNSPIPSFLGFLDSKVGFKRAKNSISMLTTIFQQIVTKLEFEPVTS